MSLAERPIASPQSTHLSPAAAYTAVVDRLEQTRRRILRCTVAAIGVSVAALLLASFATFAAVDWFVEATLLTRGLAMFSLLAVGGWMLLAGWQRWIVPYTLDRAAIDIENEVDDFGQGLRTALDYQEAADRDFTARPAAASPGLLGALHNETYAVSQRVPWNEVAPARWLWQALLAFLLLSGSFLLALAIVPELRIAAGRMLLLPWQYTQVTFEPQQKTVKQGESVVVTATIAGRPLKAANLRFAFKSKPTEWTTVDLLSTNESEQSQLLHGKVQTKLTNLREDVVFEVIAGPVKLPAGNIRVLQPLTIKHFQAEITPPAYTKKPATVVETYDLKVWEGSQVAFKIDLNRAAATGTLKRIDMPKDKPAVEFPATIEKNNLQFELSNLRESGTYTLTAVAADEMELPPQRVKIQVTLDRRPNVKWVQPEEQWEVTPTTEVTMAIAAEDDLGVHKAGIAYQVGSGKLETLWETDAAGAEQSLAAVAALLLEDRGLTHKDSVTYHAFVEDNYFDKPRRTTTPLRFIDIRPYQQNFQLVEGGGCCNGSSVTLEELIKRQREQLTQSFAAQDQLPLSKTAAKKMAAAQTELQDQTIEFAKGLAERGAEVLPLDEAGRQMGTAVIALDDGDVPAAVPTQQQALTYLIMARENLRKKLSNSSSASACRKFDKEQKQKLRLPEQKKQDQQKQLAQNKKQLEELAQRERKWSQQASQACQNPSSSSSGKPSEQQPQPSKEEVAKSQEQMLKELAELQEQIAQNELAGKTAQEQASRAKEAMEQGQKELEQNKGDAASKQGETAADRLEQLAAHLAAMNQKDFGQRLNQAQKNAAELAAKQEKLAGEVGKAGGERRESGDEGKAEGKKPGEGEQPGDEKSGGSDKPSDEALAGKQQDLAQQAKMLAEVLEKLRGDAKGEKGPAAGTLEQISAELKPAEIAAGMERTAGELKDGNKEAAKSGANQARDELSQLAQALGAAKGELTQPQLQELMKLEEQLAKLREDAGKSEGRSEKAEGKQGAGDKPGEGQQRGAAGAAKKWEQLQERLHQLAESDKRLNEALRKLGGNQPLKPGDKLRPSEFQPNGEKQEVPPGHYSWDQLGDYKGLDEVAKALQTKIQEAILAGALQDSDEPVPPEYKGLVEKYYRTLSDDLR
jgi:hypothetical protein